MKNWKKQFLILSALVLAAMCWKPALADSITSNQNSVPKSVTISFTTVLTVTKTSAKEICLVSGPSGTVVYDNPAVTIAQASGSSISQCSQALKQIKAELSRKYPLVAFNYVINGQSLNTI